MEKQAVITKVVEAVAQVQEASGRQNSGIRSSTCPVRDVEGFDSLSGVEATVILSESLGVDLPDNTFVSKDGRRALSVTEIASNILVGEGAQQ